MNARPIDHDGRQGSGDERDDAQDDQVAGAGGHRAAVYRSVHRGRPTKVLCSTADRDGRLALALGRRLGRGMQEPMARSRSKSGVGLVSAAFGRSAADCCRSSGSESLSAYWALTPVRTVSDAMDYYLLDLADPYANPWGATHAFVYSPVYAQVLYPLTLLPFEAFYKVLMAINLGALLFLVGPVWAAVALPLAHPDIANGQVHLVLAASIVLMLRSPGWGAFGVLSKVTPGVTLLWFPARREWRAFAVAAGVTATLVIVSAITWPQAWFDWVTLLSESATHHVDTFSISQWPAIFRLPIGAGLVVMAAWRVGRPRCQSSRSSFCHPSGPVRSSCSSPFRSSGPAGPTQSQLRTMAQRPQMEVTHSAWHIGIGAGCDGTRPVVADSGREA